MSGDALTAERLTPRLQARLGPHVRCTAVARGPVGNGQETWFVDVADDDDVRQLVLRRSAPGGPLEWTARGREFAVMRALAGRGLPLPAVLWCDESDDLDRPYLVMERAPGTPAMALRGDDAAAAAADLGRLLARLHRLDPHELDLDLPLPPDATVATRTAVASWRRRYHEERVAPVPVLGALLAWLEANVPADPTPVRLLWGDAGRHNALAADGRVTALLDWELAAVGHPLEDLAVAVWMEQDSGLDPAVIVDAYAAEAGAAVDRDALAYFLVLAAATRSAMVVAGVRSFVAGRTSAPSAAALGLDLVAVSLLRAAADAGWPLPDDATPAAAEPLAAATATPERDARAAPSQLRPTPAEADEGVAACLLDEVLPLVDDRRVRRQLKTAAALLRTSALRSRAEDAALARDAQATAALLDDLGRAGVDVSGGLEAVAERVESDPALAAWRPRTRAVLLAGLRDQAALLAPLAALYRRGPVTPGPARGR